jgi:hypothetical protein
MPPFNFNSLNDEEKFALFYGIMLGDGCLSYYKTKEEVNRFTIAITGGTDDKNLFEKIIIPTLAMLGRKSSSIKNKKDCNGIELNFPNKIIFDKVKFYGFPVGKKGPNINIPKHFYDKKLVKYVVAGFMATDGSLVLTKNPNKYYPRIEANGISKPLIEQVHAFLISIGMNGAFYLAKRKNPNSSYNVQQQYRFQFNGMKNLLLFHDLIGFANPKYEEKFINFLNYEEEYKKSIFNIPTQK